MERNQNAPTALDITKTVNTWPEKVRHVRPPLADVQNPQRSKLKLPTRQSSTLVPSLPFLSQLIEAQRLLNPNADLGVGPVYSARSTLNRGVGGLAYKGMIISQQAEDRMIYGDQDLVLMGLGRHRLEKYRLLIPRSVYRRSMIRLRHPSRVVVRIWLVVRVLGPGFIKMHRVCQDMILALYRSSRPLSFNISQLQHYRPPRITTKLDR